MTDIRIFKNKELQLIEEQSSAIVERMITHHEGLLISASANLADRTIRQYIKTVRSFLLFIEQNGINFHTLELYKMQLRNSELSTSTKNNYLASAKLLVKQSLRTGVLPSALAEVSNFKQEKGHKKDGLTKEEVIRLSKYIKTINKTERRLKVEAMFHLLAFQGLREFELVNIKLEDINFNDSSIQIKGKGSDDFTTIPILHDYTETAIRNWITYRNITEGYLFASKKNPSKQVSTAYIRELFTGNTKTYKGKVKRIDGIFDRCGITGRSVHGFRHFFVTFLLDSGYTLAEVQRFSRHKTFETIKVYDDRRITKKLSKEVKRQFTDITKHSIF